MLHELILRKEILNTINNFLFLFIINYEHFMSALNFLHRIILFLISS
jgi:hypothetical protein